MDAKTAVRETRGSPPWRNGYVESFNSRIRDECLNINSFWSLAQARVVISDWKHDYNHHRRSPGFPDLLRDVVRSA